MLVHFLQAYSAPRLLIPLLIVAVLLAALIIFAGGTAEAQDPAKTISIEAPVNAVEGDTVTVTLTLDPPPTSDVTVQLDISQKCGTSPEDLKACDTNTTGDFVAKGDRGSQNVTVPAGAASSTHQVPTAVNSQTTTVRVEYWDDQKRSQHTNATVDFSGEIQATINSDNLPSGYTVSGSGTAKTFVVGDNKSDRHVKIYRSDDGKDVEGRPGQLQRVCPQPKSSGQDFTKSVQKSR